MEGIVSWQLVHSPRRLYRFRESCNVYAVVRGDGAVLIDSGSGLAVGSLEEIGVRRVAHALHTHHHRDQAQAALELARGGTAIWAPETERELFENVDELWRGWDLYNNYRGAQHRDALLESVPLAGVLQDYATWTWPEHPEVAFRVLPAPGHTMGSICLIWDDLAFTGDLIYAPGKVWSVAAFQYDYVQLPGAQLAVRSLDALKKAGAGTLLPSHGEPMTGADLAIEKTQANLHRLIRERGIEYASELEELDRPFEQVLPHLLRNRKSVSSNWVLLGPGGHALFIDYGYPHWMYMTQYGGPRWGKRPLLHGLEQLAREYGVTHVDAVVVTHHHDDHVAAIPALRRVCGTQVWALENMVDVLERPQAYKTQCLWYDSIPVDRVLHRGETIGWHGIPLYFDEEPGHTRYGSLTAFTIDDTRCLAIGDQFPNNFVYANHFELGDYVAVAERWRHLKPDLILPGHGAAVPGPAYVGRLQQNGTALDEIHRALLPLDQWNLGAGGRTVELIPYQSEVSTHGEFEVRVFVKNPLPCHAHGQIRLTVPWDWKVDPPWHDVEIPAGGEITVAYRLCVGGGTGTRLRYGVEVTLNEIPLGVVEEGIAHVVPASSAGFCPVTLPSATPSSETSIPAPCASAKAEPFQTDGI